jgi:putative addiction module component (TIGR02574 family)
MSETAERLKTELASLSVEDRADLAYFLLQSLPPEADDLDEAAFKTELERRIQEIDDGTAVGEPADKVLAELRAKHS